MPHVEPAKSRAAIDETGSGLQITIPPKRNWFGIVFLVFWLIGWTVGGGFALFAVSQEKTPTFARLFLAVWLCGWALGEYSATSTLLWNLGGKEIITADGFSLALKRDIFGHGATRQFTLHEVKRLRVSSSGENLQGSTFALKRNRTTTGVIAFDYGADTIRFGEGIEEAEAHELISALKHRYTLLGQSE